MKKNILLLSFTIFLLIFLSEFFIKIFFPQDLQRYWVINEKIFGLPINKKNYIHKLHRFKSYKAEYTFGQFGNRITVNDAQVKDKDRILVMGDSFTFGWLIKNKDTYVHKFQLDNPEYNLINVSVGAWGTSNYTLFTELFCKRINPKKIFVILNSDDPQRGYSYGHYKMQQNQLIKNKKEYFELDKDSKFDQKIPLYKFLKTHSHLFMLARNVVYNIIHPPYFNPYSMKRYWPRPNDEFDLKTSKKIENFNKKLFLKLKAESKKCGSDLYVFYTGWASHEMMKDTNPNKLFFQNAPNFFALNDIYFFQNIESMKNLYKDPIKYIIDKDFHPNAKGAQLIYLGLRDSVNKILSK